MIYFDNVHTHTRLTRSFVSLDLCRIIHFRKSLNDDLASLTYLLNRLLKLFIIRGVFSAHEFLIGKFILNSHNKSQTRRTVIKDVSNYYHSKKYIKLSTLYC